MNNIGRMTPLKKVLRKPLVLHIRKIGVVCSASFFAVAVAHADMVPTPPSGLNVGFAVRLWLVFLFSVIGIGLLVAGLRKIFARCRVGSKGEMSKMPGEGMLTMKVVIMTILGTLVLACFVSSWFERKIYELQFNAWRQQRENAMRQRVIRVWGDKAEAMHPRIDREGVPQ